MTTVNPSEKNFYMEEALREAEIAFSLGEIPVGCVIVKDGEIIARGHNEVERSGSTLRHAEIVAMERANAIVGKYFYDCDIYVTLEPCAMCAGAIVGGRFSHLYYGAREEKLGCCGSRYALTEDNRFYSTVPTVGGIEEKECEDIVKRFFADRR